MEAALEGGAEDVLNNDDGSIEVLTTPESFSQVKAAVKSAELEPALAEVTMRASTSAELDGDDAAKMARLLDILEDLDDTQNVYSNADIADESLED
jgi:transcriptional/translational regulatory protein YebC/TACO1